MKKFFWLVLVIILGIVAVGMDVTLWNASRKGLPYGTTPIMGAVSRRGISTADPMTVFSYMTVLFNVMFLASFIALFPSVGIWLKRKKDAWWPPASEPNVGPPWICAHCHEENPDNFEQCWKCQRIRRREDKT
jgi:hypothetical protein